MLGGSGFIGSHITEQLVLLGNDVTVFDKTLNKKNLAGVLDKTKFVKGDFQNSAEVREALKGNEIVFHCIHSTFPRESVGKALFDAQTNIVPSVSLMESAVKENVEKIVYISSIAVYGNPEKIPITETHKTNPITPYAASKIAIENYLELFRLTSGLNYAVLRPTAAYGERQAMTSKTGVINNFVFSAIQGKPIEIFGDGSTVRDLTHAEDIATAAAKAAFMKTKSRLFNIGTGKGITLNELAEKVRQITNSKSKIIRTKSRADPEKHVFDVLRANKELGWSARISLDEGIARVFRAQKGAE